MPGEPGYLPNCLSYNSFRDAIYGGVYGAISNRYAAWGLVGLGAVEPQCAVASRCKNIAR